MQRKKNHSRKVFSNMNLAISLAAMATVPSIASAAVDQLHPLFLTAQGFNSQSVGGWTFNSSNQFWTAAFGTSGSIRRVTYSGTTWNGADYVSQADWVGKYIKSSSLTDNGGSGTVLSNDYASSTAIGDLILNPKTVLIGGVIYTPGTVAIAVDQSLVQYVDPGTGGKTEQPQYDKLVYAYDLRKVGATVASQTSGLSTRDRNNNGTVDFNDVFDTILTKDDVKTAFSGTSNTMTLGRRFSFSSDGQSIYVNDSASSYGGIWKVNITGSGSSALTKIVDSRGASRINTEPDAIAITGTTGDGHRNLGSGASSGDQVLFQGSTDTGNIGGISYVVDNGTSISSVKTLLKAKQIQAFFDITGGVGDVGSITHDSSGNIYFAGNGSSAPRGAVYQYDTSGRLSKLFSNAEQRAYDKAAGVTAYNDLPLDTKVRDATLTLSGTPTIVPEFLFSDASSVKSVTGVYAYKPGDFNRDGSVNSTDITAFKAVLGLRGATTYSIGTSSPYTETGLSANLKYDLNGSARVSSTEVATVDWKDVKILQQYAGLSDGDVDMNYTVDSTDLSTIGVNYNGTNKLFTQGNLTSVRIAAADKDTVNYADLITLAANWTATKPAAVAVGSIPASDIDKAFAVTSGGTISQLVNTTGGSLTWSSTANWSGGVVPNGAGAVASLLTKPFDDVTLDINSSYTVGQLNFDSYFDYTLSGSGTLHINGNGSTAEINAFAANPVINSGLAVDTNANVFVTYSTDTVTFGGATAIAASKTLTKTGPGSLTVTGTQSHASGSTLAITGGTVNLNSDGGSNITFNVAAATILNTSGTQNLGSILSSGLTNITSGNATVSSITGSGSVTVAGGTTSLTAGTLSQSSLSIAASSSTSTGTLTLTGIASNNGFLVNTNGGSVAGISGTGSTSVTGGTLIAGPVAQTSASTSSGATLTTTTVTLSGASTVNGTFNILSPSTASVSSVQSFTGTGTLNVDKGKLNTTSGLTLGTLSLTSGSVTKVATNGTSTGYSKLGTLSVDSTSKLDITNNSAIITGTSESDVRTMITSGFNGGDWLGTGITSSTAATDINGISALGYANNSDLGASTFNGVPLGATDTIVKYTYYGDADLSGTVTLEDFTQFLVGYQQGGTPNWINGDFDYSGTVTLEDFSLFLAGYQGPNTPLTPSLALALSADAPHSAPLAESISIVPEPTSLGLLAVGAMGLLRRRLR